MGTALPLDRVTGLSLDPGAQVVVRGAVTTSLDGSVFFVAMQRDGLSPGASRPGGLFDLAAGGLALVGQGRDGADATLAPTGDPGPGCVAAGTPSPCLVPRLGALGLERLKTASELASTLSGHVEAEGVVAPAVAPRTSGALGVVLGVAAVLAALGGLASLLRRRARTALGRIRRAALEALTVVRRDPTLAPLRERLVAMLKRADELDAARRSCAARLARMDRGALERRREAVARSSSPEAAEALGWLTAECAEAARLEADLGSSVLGLERIESALRVVALRARSSRGTTSRAARADPVDLAALELTLRDEAMTEAEEAAGS